MGKTYSLAKNISQSEKTFAFFTSNHDHLYKFKDDLTENHISPVKYIHGKGFQKSCERYPKTGDEESWTKDQRLVHKIYTGFGLKGSRLLCSNCNKKKSCEYIEYTQRASNYQITLQPLEFFNFFFQLICFFVLIVQ